MRSMFCFVSLLSSAFTIPVFAADAPLRTVAVSAQSEIHVVPDEVLVHFEVVSEDNDILMAKSSNDNTTKSVFRAVKSLGVPKEQFKVTDLGVSPRYNDGRVFVGYMVSRSFEILVHDFSKVELLVSALLEAGVTRIDQVKYQVQDQRKHQVEARRLAVLYAKEKATHLAELNNLRLGDAIRIEENVEYNMDAHGFGGFGGGAMSQLRPRQDRSLTSSDGISASIQTSKVLTKLAAFQKERDASHKPAAEGKKDRRQDDDKEMLQAIGQVSLNATVKIEFEMLPK